MQIQQKKTGWWAELPEDLLVLIATRFSLFEDFLSFSGVCRSWRSVAINDNFKGSEQIPWLMLSNKDKPDERQFVSLRKGGVIRTVYLPEARGKQCLETLGWLVITSNDGVISLLHPFTRVQINLPHVTTLKHYNPSEKRNHLRCIHKAVLSSRPDEGKDYVLVVIYAPSRHLAFWRPEDRSWTAIRSPLCFFSDINFYQGLCYGVIHNKPGVFLAVDVWGPQPTRARHIDVALGPFQQVMSIEHKNFYIVESAGQLLMVIQILRELSLPIFSAYDPFISDFKVESRVQYRTCGFKVFEVALKGTGKLVESLSLGDNALFLDDNAMISVDASRFPGVKANCIYFTDRTEGGKGIGVYNMEDGSLSPCYEGKSLNRTWPPLWVHPSSF